MNRFAIRCHIIFIMSLRSSSPGKSHSFWNDTTLFTIQVSMPNQFTLKEKKTNWRCCISRLHAQTFLQGGVQKENFWISSPQASQFNVAKYLKCPTQSKYQEDLRYGGWIISQTLHNSHSGILNGSVILAFFKVRWYLTIHCLFVSKLTTTCLYC